jgi:LysM repeat protein
MGLAISPQRELTPRPRRDTRSASHSRPSVDVPYLRLVRPIDDTVKVMTGPSVDETAADSVADAAALDDMASDDMASDDMASVFPPRPSAAPDSGGAPVLRIAPPWSPRSDRLGRASRAGRRAPVRLTRRGRLVIWLILVGIAIAIAALFAPASQASAPVGQPGAVTVHAGDTMWSIATRALPGDSPTVAMARVRMLNHLETNEVYVGEQILLPPADS